MKPEREFVAERVVASHCPQLLRPGASQADLVTALSRTAEKLARELGSALAGLLGGDEPLVECSRPERTVYSDYATMQVMGHRNLGAYTLFGAGAGNDRILGMVAGEVVLRLVDRAWTYAESLCEAVAGQAWRRSNCRASCRCRPNSWCTAWKPCWPGAWPARWAPIAPT